jgi:hypothetical protein
MQLLRREIKGKKYKRQTTNTQLGCWTTTTARPSSLQPNDRFGYDAAGAILPPNEHGHVPEFGIYIFWWAWGWRW